MIDYAKLKLGFTSGGDFLLSAADYVGYFHTLDSVAYAGYDISDKSAPLQIVNTFSSNIQTSTFFYDRLIRDNTVLPYSFDTDIAIAPNETCNSRVFNDRLKKLQTNALYLYAQTFLQSNVIPIGYDKAGGTVKSTRTINWIDQNSDSGTSFAPFASAGYAALDNVINCTAIKNAANNYCFIGITPTAFVALSSYSGFTNLDIVSIDNYVDNNTDLQFANLSCISIANGFAYICDSQVHTVYKYDISGFINGDPSISNKRMLAASIGSFGNALQKFKFNSPNIVFANDVTNRLYVNDKGNRCIKIFDLELSYVATRTFTAGANAIVRGFGYNRYLSLTYIALQQGATNIIQICDDNLNIIDSITIADILDSDEYVKGIEFSTSDSNILYLITNKNVFKKFTNRPDKTIGKWLTYRAGNVTTHIWNLERSLYNDAQWNWNEGSSSVQTGVEIQGFKCLHRGENDKTEDIFLFAGAVINNGPTKPFNRIQHYREYNVDNITLGNTQLNAYNIASVGVDENEFISAIVINRELYKIAFNTLSITQYLIGSYSAQYDYLNNLVYSGIVSIPDSGYAAINETNLLNLYVHENEIAGNSGALNRCFKLIFDLQNQVLQIISTKVTNFAASLSGTNTIALI